MRKGCAFRMRSTGLNPIGRIKKRTLACAAVFGSVALLFSAHPAFLFSASAKTAVVDPATAAEVKDNIYSRYIEKYADAKKGTGTISPAIDSFKDSDKTKVESSLYGHSGKVTVTEEGGYVEYEVDIPQEGLYQIQLEYYPAEGRAIAIQCSVTIDGETPFYEADSISLDRIWVDSGEITVDGNGNEMRPSQKEEPEWNKVSLSNTAGDNKPFRFHLSKGKHTIRIHNTRESLVLKSFSVIGAQDLPTYDEVMSQYEGQDVAGTAVVNQVEGEDSYRKSDSMLYPIFDRSSPQTSPPVIGNIKLNTIGGSRWKQAGQWIEWKITVPEDGLYKIVLRARQNLSTGGSSSRMLYIDGEIPFAEAQDIRFPYDTQWQMVELGDGEEPFLFHLEKGEHTIRLQATTGDMTPRIEEVERSLLILNACYRRIVMLTGTSPDVYRDYQFEDEIPEVLEQLAVQADVLDGISKQITEELGEKNEQIATIDRLVIQLREICKKPSTLAGRFTSFKDNIGALGTWLLTAREQPLEIDYIEVTEPAYKPGKADGNFFEKFWFEIKGFFYSFFIDYSSLSAAEASEEDTITVWTTQAREQTQVLRQLIDQSYTGGGVNLEMVAAGTLLPSVLAGIGPDVSLNTSSQDVMNYAARGAVEPLDSYDGYADVIKRFRESAMVPLSFQGNHYGLPEIQTYPVMFYRKDILAQLEVDVPETWDDVYNLLSELQKQNMEFALPMDIQVLGTGIQSFGIFLYQNGGEFYRNDGRESNLDSEISVKAFQQWTELFSNYKLPTKYDFPNRFRTGEMPIGIADYSTYNMLSVSAPEIKGMWAFAPVPGTVTEDGINSLVPATTTAGIVLSDSNKKEKGWEFLKWWTSTETQVNYGREIESVMGSAARYTSANVEAVKGLAWSSDELEILMKQWENVKAIPEYPGGYYTPRYVDFAFRKVVVSGEDPRETILDYTKTINDEIIYKRKEIGLAD